MKYPEARKLFKESSSIPYGWHYCSFHKDIESDAEPCLAAVDTGQARPLGAMKWQPTDAGSLQGLLEAAVDRLHRHLFGEERTSSGDRQPREQELASSAPIP
jgi:hypothetical protein